MLIKSAKKTYILLNITSPLHEVRTRQRRFKASSFTGSNLQGESWLQWLVSLKLWSMITYDNNVRRLERTYLAVIK